MLRGRSAVDRAAQCLREQGVPDESVAEALRQVEAVLREAGKDRFLVGDPQNTVCPEDSPYVCVRFALDLPPESVTQLGWRLTERLVERRLDYPALVVGFITAAQVQPRELA